MSDIKIMEEQYEKDIEKIWKEEYENVFEFAKRELLQNISNHNRFRWTLYEDLPVKNKNESKKEYIKRLFYEYPCLVLAMILEPVHLYRVTKKMTINPISFLYQFNNKYVVIRERLKIEDVKYLLWIEKVSFAMKNKITFQQEYCDMKFEIESVDKEAAEITIYGEIEFPDNYEYYIDTTYVEIELEYYSMNYGERLPIWLENIIIGAIYWEKNKKDIAVFKYFTGFDSFVTIIYNKISKCLDVEEFKNYMDGIIEEYQVEQIEDYIEFKCMLDDFYFEDCTDDEIDDACDKIYIEYRKEIDEIEEFIKNASDKQRDKYIHQLKIVRKDYYRQEKRLIKEKLKDIEHILQMNLNSSEYSGLSNLKSNLKKIEKFRNAIAHGNNYDMQGDELYSILSYIISIIVQKDICKTNWREFIL